jgi:hypothetical protein
VLVDTPALYWPLNETSGSVVHDASGIGVGGAFNSSTTPGAGLTYGVTPPTCCPATGTTITFSGAAGAYAYGLNNTWGDPVLFTMELWMATTTTGQTQMFADFGSQSNVSGTSFDDILYINNAGNLFGGGWTGSVKSTNVGTSSGLFTLTDGKCHHIVMAMDSSSRPNIYVDGALLVRAAVITRLAGLIGAWRVAGAEPAIPTGFFTGTISNFAVYPGTMTAARVLAHFQAGVGAAAASCPTWLQPSSSSSSSSTGSGP